MFKHFAFVFSFLLATSAFSAPNNSMGWLGVNTGLSVPSSSGTTARTMFGVSGGGKIGSEMGVGAYYLSSSKSETNGAVTATFGYDMYGVEFAYFFEGEAAGVNLGGRLGMTKTAFGASLSSSPMHYGAFVGFNKFFGSMFSLGGEISYLLVPASSASNGTALDQFGVLNFTAAAKLWF